MPKTLTMIAACLIPGDRVFIGNRSNLVVATSFIEDRQVEVTFDFRDADDVRHEQKLITPRDAKLEVIPKKK